eukprot:8015612-Pyramimonas_sp.AAC.1
MSPNLPDCTEGRVCQPDAPCEFPRHSAVWRQTGAKVYKRILGLQRASGYVKRSVCAALQQL